MIFLKYVKIEKEYFGKLWIKMHQNAKEIKKKCKNT